MFKDISINELLSNHTNDYVMVDVRSPSEYEEMTIPGSYNIPVFDDRERAEVGTLYKQVSKEAATDRGLELFSAKLPDFIKRFKELPGKKVVYCWRGGMRSKSAATFLDLMGIETYRIKGGIRTYRHWVLDQLESIELTQEAYVLNGGTGTGKTEILHRLAQEGFPVLDLEGLANHRGSVFGGLGLTPHKQKTFDSLLVNELKRLEHHPLVLFEAESKRVGKVLLPSFILNKKEEATHIFIELPIEERVGHIMTEYKLHEHHEEFAMSFKKIKRRIHSPVANQIEEELKTRNYEKVLELLLTYYYDPRYKHSAEKYRDDQKILLKVKTIDEAVNAVKGIVAEKKGLVGSN
ncbi:tRNA 2-selenouridine synthase [[Bacillus] enclensis]|uniref:tRNA 2-selenouridine synthase n=1 Tax=[Bacillus] enclensis TaxID=1402860 RepID=A0A0V8HP57_9BACI|nr:tRNA 2-selenouridine(34) synthase MnmH [[Bacillus] enclensis]KSU64348.1 tRNA 2-selenouridine synthase [[Bacillus] enclensis]SCB72726.1 tRNA 2-selenouridine synthase [[Bacillus] enclensis]